MTERVQSDPYERKPFAQRPVMVDGKRVTYGDLRTNAKAMIDSPFSSGAEKGLSNAVLALLDQVESMSPPQKGLGK